MRTARIMKIDRQFRTLEEYWIWRSSAVISWLNCSWGSEVKGFRVAERLSPVPTPLTVGARG